MPERVPICLVDEDSNTVGAVRHRIRWLVRELSFGLRSAPDAQKILRKR